MSNWITAADGSLVNLDHVLTIEVMQSSHNTFKIVADLGTINKYLLSSDNKKGVDLAFLFLTKSLKPNDAHTHGFLANTVREEKDKTTLPQHLDPAGKANQAPRRIQSLAEEMSHEDARRKQTTSKPRS